MEFKVGLNLVVLVDLLVVSDRKSRLVGIAANSKDEEGGLKGIGSIG